MRKITKHRPTHINQTTNPYFITGRTYFGLPYFDTDEKKELALLSAIKEACKNYWVNLDGWVILNNHYHLVVRPPGCEWDVGIRNSDFSRDEVIADKSANSGENEVALLSATKNFHVGKFVGVIHGRSSSLLKKIRSSAFTRDSSYADWWEAKYWEEIKRKNIKLFGKRSKLAEEKRSQEFWRLLKKGTPQQLADFVKKISRVWYQYTDHVIRDQKDYFMHLNYIHQNSVKHGFSKQMTEYKWSSIHGYIKKFGREYVTEMFRKYPVLDFKPKMEDFN